MRYTNIILCPLVVGIAVFVIRTFEGVLYKNMSSSSDEEELLLSYIMSIKVSKKKENFDS